MYTTWFRKNENRAGRWTSPDPYNGSASVGDPQSFIRYSYVQNQPTNFIYPSGLNEQAPQEACSFSVRTDGNGDPIYDGYIVNGRCVSNSGPPVQVYWMGRLGYHLRRADMDSKRRVPNY